MTSARWRARLRRGPREWRWVIARRLDPRRRARFSFDSDLQIEVRLQDELALRYAMGQEFEPDVCEFFRRLLHPGMVVFDLGANIGHFTLLAAKRVAPSGFVHAFEPAPEEYEKLCANVSLNGFTQVVTNRLAVCDRVGSVELQTAGPGLGLYNSLGVPFRSSKVATVTVPCTTLDEYVWSSGVRHVDLVKLDVEGAEPLVLRGSTSLLAEPNAPILVCEFSDPAAAALGHSTRELRRSIVSLGYTIYTYDLKQHCLLPEVPRDWYDYTNMICCKSVPALLPMPRQRKWANSERGSVEELEN